MALASGVKPCLFTALGKRQDLTPEATRGKRQGLAPNELSDGHMRAANVRFIMVAFLSINLIAFNFGLEGKCLYHGSL
jgi:hypothetical protein